jgi:hypothetical protein
MEALRWRTLFLAFGLGSLLFTLLAKAATPTYAGRTKPQAIAAAKLGATSLVAYFTRRTDPQSRAQIRRFYEMGSWTATRSHCSTKPAWKVQVRYTEAEISAARTYLAKIGFPDKGTNPTNKPMYVVRSGLTYNC